MACTGKPDNMLILPNIKMYDAGKNGKSFTKDIDIDITYMAWSMVL